MGIKSGHNIKLINKNISKEYSDIAVTPKEIKNNQESITHLVKDLLERVLAQEVGQDTDMVQEAIKYEYDSNKFNKLIDNIFDTNSSKIKDIKWTGTQGPAQGLISSKMKFGEEVYFLDFKRSRPEDTYTVRSYYITLNVYNKKKNKNISVVSNDSKGQSYPKIRTMKHNWDDRTYQPWEVLYHILKKIDKADGNIPLD